MHRQAHQASADYHEAGAFEFKSGYVSPRSQEHKQIDVYSGSVILQMQDTRQIGGREGSNPNPIKRNLLQEFD